jgi:hypothetical protein
MNIIECCIELIHKISEREIPPPVKIMFGGDQNGYIPNDFKNCNIKSYRTSYGDRTKIVTDQNGTYKTIVDPIEQDIDLLTEGSDE